jgi:hypothetical protein
MTSVVRYRIHLFAYGLQYLLTHPRDGKPTPGPALPVSRDPYAQTGVEYLLQHPREDVPCA